MRERVEQLITSRTWLTVEFLLLCVALPTVIIVWRLAPMMFFFLWSATVYCYVIFRLITHNRESFRSIWKWGEVTWANLRPMLVRFVFVAIGMTLITLYIDAIEYFEEPRLFYLPRVAPEFVLLLCVVYPIFSALPQEFIFCTFFFERYPRFFPGKWSMIVASAVVFAYAHVLFINWVAPVLSLIGGLVFASTYAKTRSLALVTIEHGLYGNYLFVVGLGWFFFGGAVE